MMLNFIDKIGDWNPQLLREIKGRLKVFNIVIAVCLSLIAQLGIFLYQLGSYPGEKYAMSGTYCNLSAGYQQRLNSVYPLINQVQQKINSYTSKPNFDPVKLQVLKTQLANLKTEQTKLNKLLYDTFCPTDQINLQIWWRDHWEYIFLTLSVMFVFILLVAGTYLLINNLAQEDHRGTLNFLRLTPQSEMSILTGKMLGVPIVIYLIVLTALPLHLLAGLSAKFAFSHILSFDIVLVASCIFFYSYALLFALISRWFSGFQPWLASGAVLLFLFITLNLSSHSTNIHNTATWLRLLSPFDMMGYLFGNLFSRYDQSSLDKLQLFYLPLGKSLVGLVGLHLLNYGVGIYWAWQALQRRFCNPNTAVLNKSQSYWFVGCCQLVFWGFTLQYTNNYCSPYVNNCYYDLNHQIGQNFFIIAFFNLVLLFGMMVILSPHRQEIQDWSRYSYHQVSNRKWFLNNSWLKDVIWSEKSPALIAMVINLLIILTPLVAWIILAPALNFHHNNAIDWVNKIGRMKAILSVALFISMMMIYTTLAQLMLLMKNPKRGIWAMGTVGVVMFIPPTILGFLGISPSENSLIWLLSSFPWVGIQEAATITVFMALLSELTVLTLLNFKLNRQIKLAGESATQALLAGR
ncbi:ABC transporter permease subunit [Anabaena sp. UHCC 0399]|uniref:ABC transporter permease subunit n=1 Tax=Anabaena sp. UHCC 0399 TaxID=3110238 RepID=UPI002B20174A|nr:ABC transporter permease subunit [Anabaena sp. UHCC 0399]MEA5565814.1 ABC transporter permease subunit [Anabaena sp. UHCC 0399]